MEIEKKYLLYLNSSIFINIARAYGLYMSVDQADPDNFQRIFFVPYPSKKGGLKTPNMAKLPYFAKSAQPKRGSRSTTAGAPISYQVVLQHCLYLELLVIDSLTSRMGCIIFVIRFPFSKIFGRFWRAFDFEDIPCAFDEIIERGIYSI